MKKKENNMITEDYVSSENCKHSFREGLRENQVKGKFGKDHIASKPIVCVETRRVYNCQREVAEELGEDYKWTSHLSRACKFGLLDHGFHWRYYEPNELVKLLFEKGYTKYPLSYDGDYWFCYIQMAMKWLREVHNLVIQVELIDFLEHGEVWLYSIIERKTIKQLTGRDEDFTEHSCEEACEAAIKYCLENLI